MRARTVDYMDPHNRFDWNTYIEEYNINEGLILTHSLEETDIILTRAGYNIKVNYDNNDFYLFINFDKNYNVGLAQLNKIKTLLNNLGYFISSMISDEDIQYKWDVFNMINFDLYYTKHIFKIKFTCEALYDMLVKHIPEILYHVTPTDNYKNILKIGLVPKSRSKMAFHPERVYLVKNLIDCKSLAYNLYIKSERKTEEWTILKIDTTKIPNYFKLYKDPNYIDKSFYTL